MVTAGIATNPAAIANRVVTAGLSRSDAADRGRFHPPATAAPSSAGVPPISTSAGPDDLLIGTEVETPDGEAPSRPRRRRGGRGRGRGREGREGGERDARPDLEARGEDVRFLSTRIRIRPYRPCPRRRRPTRKWWNAWRPPTLRCSLKRPRRSSVRQRRRRSSPTRTRGCVTKPDERSEPVAAAAATARGRRPAPPVAPVDPSKASFSLLGWLKGGG